MILISNFMQLLILILIGNHYLMDFVAGLLLEMF